MRPSPTIPFIAHHPLFMHPLPEGHRFPMLKYELLPQQLLWENVVSENDFFSPGIVDRKYIEDIHQTEYIDKLFSLSLNRQEIRRIGFPLSSALIGRELRIAQGSIDARKQHSGEVSASISPAVHTMPVRTGAKGFAC